VPTIKQELHGHLAGDYAPNFPKPKVVADCGIFGLLGSLRGAFDSKKSGRRTTPTDRGGAEGLGGAFRVEARLGTIRSNGGARALGR
jgi:hypothetical protein